jgi:hypothetical protein
MDAVEFIREKERMCRTFNDNCKNKDGNNSCCGLRYEADKSGESCEEYISNHPAEAVEIVERWGKEHPLKNRQNEFLKLFPRGKLAPDGMLKFCPQEVDSGFMCPMVVERSFSLRLHCEDCRRKYWLEEVEE